MPAVRPDIPSCDMRVISSADVPIPAPTSRYVHDSAITVVSAAITTRRSRLTTASSVASTDMVIRLQLSSSIDLQAWL